MSRPAPDNALSIEEIDRLVHEPARFLLLAHLQVVAEADFVYLVHSTGLSAGNAGSHLKKLEAAGYVEATKQFVGNRPQTMYGLTKAGEKAFVGYRREMRALLDATEA